MKGQNNKKYQQKEHNLICKTDKKTINYIFFFFSATQQKPRKLITQKLIFDFRGQNETKHNRISTLLL